MLKSLDHRNKITMEVKNEIFELLKTDYELVKKIADALDIKTASVERWAYRQQHRCVALYAVVNIIKEHTKYTDNQIFEPIKKVA